MLQGNLFMTFLSKFALFQKGNSPNEFLIFRLSPRGDSGTQDPSICVAHPLKPLGLLPADRRGKRMEDTCFLTTWPSSGTQPLCFHSSDDSLPYGITECGKFWQRSFWLGRHFPETAIYSPWRTIHFGWTVSLLCHYIFL